ncbi:MAG: hypothetical protein ACXVJ0_17285, partial [Candidatus Angelobacter sp.]
MKCMIFAILLLCVGCAGGPVHAAATLRQRAAAGGRISLPPGTITLACGEQLVISRSTAIIGAGRDLTILHDTCPTGDTVFVDVTNPA